MTVRRLSKKPLPIHRVIQRRNLPYIRDLLFELVSRDIKLQYKRSVLGIAWSFITPLMQLAVYYFVFRLIIALAIPQYATFAFTGMLVWTWTQMSLFQGAGAITNNRDLVRRPGFPAAILPVVTVTTNLVNFLLSLPILVIFLWLEGSSLQPALIAFPVLIIIQYCLTLSFTYLIAALNVTFRDTQHIIGVLLNIVFYLTPIFYAMSSIPEQYRGMFYLNPMTYLVEAYRTIFLQGMFPNFSALLVISLATAGLLWLGYQVFDRASSRFAEEL